MTMPSNVSKAMKAIAEMPNGFWIDVRALAKKAHLSVRTMSRFLVQAQKGGLVENKRVPTTSGRLHIWRRIA
jgi:CTP-dependent riboflavin kinase